MFVKFRDCTCPATPHAEGDGVTLRPHLGFVAGAQAARAMAECLGDEAKLDELLGPIYLRNGPVSWNLEDEDGPIELDPEALLALPFDEASIIVVEADKLYSESVMRPLRLRLNEYSRNGRTRTTSATPRSSRKVRKPSRPSSRATSADGTPPVP